jgi:DNA processing protein
MEGIVDAPIDVLERADPRYPARLEDLFDAPERVWVAGALPATPAVAIVGTRRADRAACRFAERLAGELGRSGVGVVSGGAAGVDAAAHRGALAVGAATWVVQAAPLTDPYPRAHRRLFAEVLERGGWLSETAPGRAAHPGRFLARNRLIAALADAVVVVQAPARSGALSTARWASRLERPLYAVPGAPWDPRAAGTVRLLAAGARPCVDAAAILAALDREPAEEGELPPRPPLPAELASVAAALDARPTHVDELVARTGRSAAEVQVALVRLAGLGRAVQSAGGWLAR